MSAEPPSQKGSFWEMAMPKTPRSNPKTMTVVSPWRNMLLAPLKSFEPKRWATWTEKPEHTAVANPYIIQVLVETRPMDAEGPAPRRPTMPASMYCIITELNWARMAGRLSITMSLNWRGMEISSPSLTRPNRKSLLSLAILPETSYLGCLIRNRAHKDRNSYFPIKILLG